MRKIVISLLVSMLALSASAQRVGFGPKAGINISMLTDKYIDYSTRVSYHAGAFLEYDFSKCFSIELAALYSSQGGKVNKVATSLIESSDATLRLNYINIPLLAKFYMWRGLNIFAGPQFGFVVSAQQKIEGGDWLKVRDDWRTFNIYAVGGVGYTWRCGLLLSAQYNWGFIDMYRSRDVVRNGVLQISAGWRF